MKILDKLNADPRVDSAEIEIDDERTVWVYLTTGYRTMIDPIAPLHSIHTRTLRQALAEMSSVKPCTCSDCRPACKPSDYADVVNKDLLPADVQKALATNGKEAP
jgi:hypothetical protein